MKWVIIFAIGGILATSCMPRSVRVGGQPYFSNSSQDNEIATNDVVEEKYANNTDRDITFINEDELPEILKKIEEEEARRDIDRRGDEIIEESDEPAVYDMAARSLPTLREQMQLLGESQDDMNSKMDRMQSDVTYIKNTVDEIKDILISKGADFLPAKGPTPKIDAVEDKKQTPKKDEFIILSDEQKNAENKAKPAPVKKLQAPAKRDLKIRKTANTKPDPVQNINEPNDEKTDETAPENISDALEYFKKKDYKSTIVYLEIIIEKDGNPETVSECHYWIGESHFGLKEYRAAIEHFKKVAEYMQSGRRDDAQVMIAESFMRIGEVPSAKEAFRELVTAFPTSEYVPRARKMLQQL